MGNSIETILPDKTYTRSKASKLVNRSTDTLKRWHHSGLLVPSTQMQAGKLRVWLYTEEDITKLKQIAATRRPGRKPKSDIVTQNE
jgi:DNA-binding transcriptional MerR regulator